MKKLKSRPSDPEKIRKKIETSLRKHDLGEPLTEKELLIVQWIRYSGGCAARRASGGRQQFANQCNPAASRVPG